jgi:hypothetical protein
MEHQQEVPVRKSESPQTGCNPASASTQLHPILQLQQDIGNRAIQRLLASRGSMLQRRLTVGAANDPYEQEADRVARQVMGMSATAVATLTQGHVQRQSSKETIVHAQALARTITPILYRTFEKKDEFQSDTVTQEKLSDPSCSFEPEADFGARLSIAGGGKPLSESTRAFMEERFGTDFGEVRLHTDGEASQLNRAIGAQAFTHGRHVYVGEDNSNLESSAGMQLLAHELTHVVQQTGNRPLRPFGSDTTLQTASDLSNGRAGGACNGYATKDIRIKAKARISSDGREEVEQITNLGTQQISKPHVSLQRYSWDQFTSDAKAVATAAGQGAQALGAEIASGAEAAVDRLDQSAEQVTAAGQAAIGGGEAAGSSIASTSVGAVVDDAKRAATRTMLKGRIDGLMQRLQAIGGNAKPSETQRQQLNIHISNLNAAAPPFLIPTLAEGEGIKDVGIAIGIAIGGEAILPFLGLVAVVAFILLILVALAMIVAENVDDGETEKEKEEEKEKEKKDEKKKEKEDEPCPKPLMWNPTTTVQNVVNSGGIVGALEPCGIATPHSLFYVGHHVWPKFAGGPESQPLMGIFGFVHSSIVHPGVNTLLTTTFPITTHTTDPKNITFIARLRKEPALRSQVALVLTGYYQFLNLQTEPPINPYAYVPGISSSLIYLSL